MSNNKIKTLSVLIFFGLISIQSAFAESCSFSSDLSPISLASGSNQSFSFSQSVTCKIPNNIISVPDNSSAGSQGLTCQKPGTYPVEVMARISDASGIYDRRKSGDYLNGSIYGCAFPLETVFDPSWKYGVPIQFVTNSVKKIAAGKEIIGFNVYVNPKFRQIGVIKYEGMAFTCNSQESNEGGISVKTYCYSSKAPTKIIGLPASLGQTYPGQEQNIVSSITSEQGSSDSTANVKTVFNVTMNTKVEAWEIFYHGHEVYNSNMTGKSIPIVYDHKELVQIPNGQTYHWYESSFNFSGGSASTFSINFNAQKTGSLAVLGGDFNFITAYLTADNYSECQNSDPLKTQYNTMHDQQWYENNCKYIEKNYDQVVPLLFRATLKNGTKVESIKYFRAYAVDDSNGVVSGLNNIEFKEVSI